MKHSFLLKLIFAGACVYALLPVVVFASTTYTQNDASAVLYGSASSDKYGDSIATGSFDGDGYDDIAISAPTVETGGLGQNGEVYVYRGGAAFTGSETPYQTLTGVVDSGQLGSSSLGGVIACDLDGANGDDLIIGDFDNVNILYNIGSGFGSLSSGVQLSLTDRPGAQMACGNINGDGYEDLVFSDIGNDTLYIIYGGVTHLTDGSASSRADVAITQESDGSQFANLFITLGDINGDGFEDVLASDTTNSSMGSHSGAIYIFYGDNPHIASGVNSTVGVEITGAEANDTLGYYLAAGDVNNDAIEDIIVRDPDTSSSLMDIAGSLTNFTSGTYTSLRNTLLTSSPRAAITLRDIDGLAGEAPDLILGGISITTQNDALNIVLNPESLTLGRLSSVQDASITDSSKLNSGFGENYAIADLDGDGILEFYIGASRADNGATSSTGAVYVYPVSIDADADGYYGDGGLLSSTDCDDSDAALHASVTYYADADGDGYGDGGVSQTQCDSATAPSGYVLNSSDGDDIDYDNDGYETSSDCDDTDGAVYDTYYTDEDGDGLGSDAVVCEDTDVASGLVATSTDTNDDDYDNDGVETEDDCNDTDAALTSESTYYSDADDDGLGDPAVSTSVCSASIPDGYVANTSDADPDISNGGTHDSTLGYTSASDLSDTDLASSQITAVAGAAEGHVLVTYSDGITYSYPVFDTTTSSLTKVKQFDNTGYILVLQPKGKKIALVNGYTGEVIKRIQLSKKLKFTKNSLKVLDVRHDGTMNVVVTSRKSGTVKVTVLSLKKTTAHLRKRDALKLTDLSEVKVKKTKAPKKRIELKNSSGVVLQTLKVDSNYQFTLSE